MRLEVSARLQSFTAEEALLFALILERQVDPTKRKQDVGSSVGLTEVL